MTTKTFFKPFKPFDNNILFVTDSSNEGSTGFIHYDNYFNKGKMWHKWGRTNNKVKRTNLKQNSKVLVFIMNKQGYNKNDVLLENIPLNIEKIYFIVNDFTKDVFDKLQNNLKIPFNCKRVLITKYSQVEELKTECQYAIHSFE